VEITRGLFFLDFFAAFDKFSFFINKIKIYCDTCIYRDVFEGRKGRWIDFGEVALNVFRQVKSKEFTLIISDWVIDEFKKYKDENIEIWRYNKGEIQ